MFFCKHGHELTKENTYRWTSPRGKRLTFCRECGRRRSKDYMDASPDRLAVLIERFHKHVVADEATGCWLWTGRLSHNGYGRFGARRAHSFSYFAFKGVISPGMEPDHICRVRRCVNPDHLEAVTRRENTLRGDGPAAINSRKTHCIRGHPFSDDNLRIDVNGYRNCRACDRARRVAWRAAHPKPKKPRVLGMRCRRGHLYEGGNLYTWHGPDGKTMRCCRACSRMRDATRHRSRDPVKRKLYAERARAEVRRVAAGIQRRIDAGTWTPERDLSELKAQLSDIKSRGE